MIQFNGVHGLMAKTPLCDSGNPGSIPGDRPIYASFSQVTQTVDHVSAKAARW